MDQFASKPVNLFDPNFLQQNQMGGNPQLSSGVGVADSVFGAQNITNVSAGSAPSVDLSNMGERDRRIFLRDLERKNRVQGGGQPSTSYGIPEPPPI